MDHTLLPRRRALALAAATSTGLLTACGGDNPTSSTSASSAAPSHPPLLTTAPRGATVAFVGDSFSVGVGAPSPEQRWTTLVCKHIGWQETNVAISGQGYLVGRESGSDYAGQLKQAVAAKPDLIIISGGWNDISHGHNADETAAAGRALFAAAQQSRVRTVVISPLAPASGPPKELSKLAELLAKEAPAHGLEYLDMGMPATRHPDWISPDGLHPNAKGYSEIAALTEKKLLELN